MKWLGLPEIEAQIEKFRLYFFLKITEMSSFPLEETMKRVFIAHNGKFSFA